LLERLLAERLSEEEGEGLERHLAGCGTCQARLEQLTGGPVEERCRRWRAGQSGGESPFGGDRLPWLVLHGEDSTAVRAGARRPGPRPGLFHRLPRHWILVHRGVG